jgi:hypothetical protein
VNQGVANLSSREIALLQTIAYLHHIGVPWVNQEDIRDVIGMGIYRAFKVMDGMKDAGLLVRDGWRFALTAEGIAALRELHPRMRFVSK